MDYCFNGQTSIAYYSLYKLFYGLESILLSIIGEKFNVVVDLDDQKILAQVL